MKKTVILNFANHVGRYGQMQQRLRQALDRVGYTGDILFFNHEEHISLQCPYHKSEDPKHHSDGKVVPYAFKAYAMKLSIDRGYDNIIWMDAAVYPSKDITAFIHHIETRGYLFFDNIGFSIGDYTSDACLKKWGWTRDQAFRSPMIMACVMGISRHNATAMEWFAEYYAAATDGVSYLGAWNNLNGEVSEDLRVKGHRHDQSVASIILANKNMNITNAQDTYFAYTSHKGVLKVADTVCLWSEGI